MCRNIRVLHNFDPPTTPEEIRDAAIQYVRKVGGIQKVTIADQLAFDKAVADVTSATERLLQSLAVRGAPKNRELEREKAKAIWASRAARIRSPR